VRTNACLTALAVVGNTLPSTLRGKSPFLYGYCKQVGDDSKVFADGGWCQLLQSVISPFGKIGTAQICHAAFCKWIGAPHANAIFFHLVSVLKNGHFTFILVECLQQRCGFRLAAVDEYAPIHFIFNIARVNLDAAGGQATGGSSGGSRISADGSTIVFNTNATNLIPGDVNGVLDVVSVANPLVNVVQLVDTTGPEITQLPPFTASSIQFAYTENVTSNGGTPTSFKLNGAGPDIATVSSITENVVTFDFSPALQPSDWLLATIGDDIEDLNGNASSIPPGVMAAFGGSGDNTMDLAGVAVEFIAGGAGNDTITAGSIDADIEGGAGGDTISGGIGLANYFDFAQGDSTVVAFAENGGVGVSNGDTFTFAGGALDLINDFGAGDVIDIFDQQNFSGFNLISTPANGQVTDQGYFAVQGGLVANVFTANNTGADTLVVYDGDSTSAASQTAFVLSAIMLSDLNITPYGEIFHV